MYNLKGGCSEVGFGFFSHVIADMMKGNSLKFHQGRLCLDIRNSLFSNREVRLWNRLSGEVVESLFLEVFKKWVDVTVRDVA